MEEGSTNLTGSSIWLGKGTEVETIVEMQDFSKGHLSERRVWKIHPGQNLLQVGSQKVSGGDMRSSHMFCCVSPKIFSDTCIHACLHEFLANCSVIAFSSSLRALPLCPYAFI